MWKEQFFRLTLTTLFRLSKGCEIHGTDSGQCTYRYLPETYQNETEKQARNIAQSLWACEDGDDCMPYCGKYIAAYYPVCVPQTSFLSRDQNFPQGRFLSHTTREKDRWVEESAIAMIEERISIETNRTARKLGVDEYGNKGRTKVRFHKNKACQESYKKFACWLNFPRCGECVWLRVKEYLSITNYFYHFVLRSSPIFRISLHHIAHKHLNRRRRISPNVSKCLRELFQSLRSRGRLVDVR